MKFLKSQKYGSKKEGNIYKYSKNIMNNTFKIDIEITEAGVVTGKIYDLSFEEEYTNFRIEDSVGPFVGKVREEFKNLLNDIKDKCFVSEPFLYNQSNKIAKMIKEKYGDEPEFEWEKSPGFATFKNKKSKKWYGIIMNIDKSKLDKKLSGEVEIINVKLEQSEIENLVKQEGFYLAYHMNKKNWITIVLDNTVSNQKVMELIDKSYSYTVDNNSKENNEWIVPANPKYFDIEKALKESDTIMWKQSTDIKVDDIVYLYVAEPFSSIMYKFKAVEVNIPYEYKDKNVKMKKTMKIHLISRYEKEKWSFNKLKEYGINAVRGPRYMPSSLSKVINEDK